jgi:hypothetical protein
MHNRLWLSLLLALFLTASGCAKHEDNGSATDSVAPVGDSKSLPAEKRAETTSSERTDMPEKKPALEDKSVEQKMPAAQPAAKPPVPATTSPAPAATGKTSAAAEANTASDALRESDSPGPQPNKAKADRKKEAGAANEQAAPSGDDMERMD